MYVIPVYPLLYHLFAIVGQAPAPTDSDRQHTGLGYISLLYLNTCTCSTPSRRKARFSNGIITPCLSAAMYQVMLHVLHRRHRMVVLDEVAGRYEHVTKPLAAAGLTQRSPDPLLQGLLCQRHGEKVRASMRIRGVVGCFDESLNTCSVPIQEHAWMLVIAVLEDGGQHTCNNVNGTDRNAIPHIPSRSAGVRLRNGSIVDQVGQCQTVRESDAKERVVFFASTGFFISFPRNNNTASFWQRLQPEMHRLGSYSGRVNALLSLNKGLRWSSSKSSFDILAHPAPGNPFHLAIPVHDMKLGKLLLIATPH